MTGSSRYWWSAQFIRVFESGCDPQCIVQARALAHVRPAVAPRIDDGVFEVLVTDEPNVHLVRLRWTPIDGALWAPMLVRLSERADILSQLFLNDFPESIAALTEAFEVSLVPCSPRDVLVHCDCAAFLDPCQHAACAAYWLANALDQWPLMIFELRGLQQDRLAPMLGETPLGRALLGALSEDFERSPSDSAYFPPVTLCPISAQADGDYWRFWTTDSANSEPPCAITPLSPVSAAVLKRGGDQPPFWPLRRSFITTMEAFYERVRRFYRDML